MVDRRVFEARAEQLWAKWRPTLRYYLAITRLDHWREWLLAMAPMLWGLWLAAGGFPLPSQVVTLVLATVALVAALALFNDWFEARTLKVAPGSYIAQGELQPRRALQIVGVALLLALLLLYSLNLLALYWGVAVALLGVALPWLRRRLFVIQGYLGLTVALGVPLAYGALGELPDRAGWLLYCAVVFWMTAIAVQFSTIRQQYEVLVGVRSISQLMDGFSHYLVIPLQLATLITLLMLAQQWHFNTVFHVMLLFATLQVGRQSLALLRGGEVGMTGAFHQQLLFALLVWLGFLFNGFAGGYPPQF